MSQKIPLLRTPMAWLVSRIDWRLFAIDRWSFLRIMSSVGEPIGRSLPVWARISIQLRQAGFGEVAALAVTGYGKDLLKDVIGADLGIVETVAHATAALHYFPDADVICDVGGCDVKIMILRLGTVADFRLNSQTRERGVFAQFRLRLADAGRHLKLALHNLPYLEF